MRSTLVFVPVALMTLVLGCLAAPAMATPPPAPGMMMNDEGLRERQEHLLQMHDLSNRILSAKDPKEKAQLKDEQLQLMKSYELKHHEMMQRHMKEMMDQKPKR